MRAVHVGAGKIGRGFIGLLLRKSGYDVTFVDTDPALVAALAASGAYPVHLLADDPDTDWVRGVTALDGNAQAAAAAEAIAQADLVTTSVGARALPHVAPLIAAGLERRRSGTPLTVIACENAVSASSQLAAAVAGCVSGAAAAAVYPNAVIDRIVPDRDAGDDPLAVSVEPYAEWLVDASALPPSLPPIVGMRPVTDLPAYVERKLFMLNMGHALTAYVGKRAGFASIHDAVVQPAVRAALATALVEVSIALHHTRSLDEAELAAYARQIISRFENPLLADRVDRVGRDPARKLAPGERFAGPAVAAAGLGIRPHGLARGIAAGLLFDRTSVAADEAPALIADVCGFAPGTMLSAFVAAELMWLQRP